MLLTQHGSGLSRNVNRTAAMAVSQPDPEDHHHPPPHPPPPPENGFVTPEAPSPGLMLSRVDGCVLPFLGGFGRYQKQLVVLTWIPALFIGCSQFSDYFLLAQPNSTCPLTINGTSVTEHENTSAMATAMTIAMTSTAPLIPHARNTEAAKNGSERAAAVEHCPCENRTHQLLSGLTENVVTKVLHTHTHCARTCAETCDHANMLNVQNNYDAIAIRFNSFTALYTSLS